MAKPLFLIAAFVVASALIVPTVSSATAHSGQGFSMIAAQKVAAA